MTFDYTQIPYAKYDVFVYFEENTASAGSVAGSITDGTTTHNLTSTAGAVYTGTLTENTNYVRFAGLTATTASIDFTGGAVNTFTATGIQLVERTD